MRGSFETAGVLTSVRCASPDFGRLVERAVGAELHGGTVARPAVALEISRTRRPFAVTGLSPVTRGALSDGARTVLHDAGGSGFDLQLSTTPTCLHVEVRWRPGAAARALRVLAPRRFELLAREVLLFYPAMWWAGRLGRAPVHAFACRLADGAVPLLAGPGGVGKSTLLQGELAAGGSATSDNLAVSDGVDVFGVVEPARFEQPGGRRTTHGRIEAPLSSRETPLRPTAVVVVRRGPATRPVVRPIEPEQAARAITTGTLIAGELRRYWAFAATMTLATGVGPDVPQVRQVAERLAGRLPCFELELGCERERLAASLQTVAPHPAAADRTAGAARAAGVHPLANSLTGTEALT